LSPLRENGAVPLARILVVLLLLFVSATPVAGDQAPLTVVGRAPAWLAPGGRFVVSGSTVPGGTAVRVTAGALVLGRARSAANGRFEIDARAPARTGSYRLKVVTASSTRGLGVLPVRPVRIAAAGDFTPGDRIAELAASRGASYAWRSVGPLLKSADIATLNLEGAVATRGSPVPDKQYHFRGSRSVLAGAVAAAGLDVVTVANNHSLDFGPAAFLDTVAALRSLGVRAIGGGANVAAARRPAVMEVGGLSIAFIGYSDINPYGFSATSRTPGTAPADPETIGADVARAARTNDVVVCWFHWGVELASTPTARQDELASACLNSGAQIVLGAHPHVLEPIVRPARRSVVAFSLGNFVFPAASPNTERTGVLEIDVAADGVRGFRLDRAKIVDGQPRLSRPARPRR
jgi:poly-gamma-glutamate synthesis protein (capsule biosynthesis protein)